MRIDPAGLPFIGGALARAGRWRGVASAGRSRPVRRPRRLLPVLLSRSRRARRRRADDAVLSPADGRVLVAGAGGRRRGAARATWQQISIFLSPMDVHVNRVPVSGRVTRVSYHAGPVPAGLPPRRRRRPTSAARSGSITTARRSSRGRSSACSRAASSAALQAGADGARRRSLRRHEVRLADGRVPAGRRPRCASRSGETVRGGETVIAVLH